MREEFGLLCFQLAALLLIRLLLAPCEMGLSRLPHYMKIPIEHGRCEFSLCEELRPVRPATPTLEWIADKRIGAGRMLGALGLDDFGLLPASKMHGVSLLRVQQRPKRSSLRGNSEQGSQ
jgi:hypothetical protein